MGTLDASHKRVTEAVDKLHVVSWVGFGLLVGGLVFPCALIMWPTMECFMRESKSGVGMFVETLYLVSPPPVAFTRPSGPLAGMLW